MSEDAPEPYEVFYTNGVVSFMIDAIWSKRVYEKVDSYRSLLAQFPDLGTPYDPVYVAARPPFPCRHIAVPDTPMPSALSCSTSSMWPRIPKVDSIGQL